MGLFSLLGIGNKAMREALLRGAIIIDVRTATEFDQGHIPEAINIPVDRIAANAERIKAMKRPVVLCCNSGARSSTAKQILLAKGIAEVHNGGNWERVWKTLRKL